MKVDDEWVVQVDHVKVDEWDDDVQADQGQAVGPAQVEHEDAWFEALQGCKYQLQHR